MALQQWQRTHNAMGSHGDHSTMPGMATQDQLNALGAARGKDFDRMFLDLMIKHHEGALTLRIEQQGNLLFLEASDDGRGIDVKHVRQAAESRGVVSPEELAWHRRGGTLDERDELPHL